MPQPRRQMKRVRLSPVSLDAGQGLLSLIAMKPDCQVIDRNQGAALSYSEAIANSLRSSSDSVDKISQSLGIGIESF